MSQVAGGKLRSVGTFQSEKKTEDKVTPLLTGLYMKFVKTRTQLVFFVIFLAVGIMCYPMFKTYNDLIESRRNANKNYEWAKYSDFWITIVAALVFFVIKQAFYYVFFPIYMRVIDEKHKGQARIDRAEKGARSVFKCCFFLSASVVGWFVLKDLEFMPKSLLCNGDFNKIFKDFPYFKKTPYFNIYYLIQFGYHLEGFVSQLFSKPKNDYIEMMLHHVVTVLLIFLSYMSNFTNVGAPVMFLHDWSDILTSSTRVLLDLPGCKVLTVISFFFLVTSWVYTRLFVFPFEIMGVGLVKFKLLPNQHPFAHIFLVTLMLVLLLLHIYWFYLFMKIAYKLIVEKKQEDLQNKLEDEKEDVSDDACTSKKINKIKDD